MALCGLCGFNHLGFRSSGITHPNIIQNALPEQESVLKDETDLPHQFRLRYFTNVYPANTNTSLGYIPKAGDQIGNRALSTTRRTNDGRHFSLSGHEGHTVEGFNRSVCPIRERNMVEFNVVALLCSSAVLIWQGRNA